MQVLDAQGRPLGRVISWLDPRGRPFDQALMSELGREWFLQHVYRGCAGLSIGQVLRLRQEDPGLLRAPHRVGFVGDIIVGRLCGHAAHDCTSCSLTLLLNPRLRQYDPELLQRLELDASQLPDLIPPRESAGGLREDVAQATGLRAGIPVSAAIHDQYASALGTAAVRAGTVMVGTGTAWVLLAINDRLAAPVIDEAFVCHHVVEGLCGQILSLVNGGSSFTWALNLLGLGDKDSAAIEQLLASTQPGSDGLSFWPFLVPAGVSGLVPGTKGRLSGLQLAHRPADVLRAVVEGLAFELSRYLDFLRAAGWPVARLVMGGGAASSRVTTQILADVTGLPLACVDTGEASLLGAAILARGLVDTDMSLADLSEAMTRPARRVEPGTQASFYRDQYQQYLHTLPLQGARQS
jgi:xylulokinase